MRKHWKKIGILALLLVIVFAVYASNRPPRLNIERLFAEGSVPNLMQGEQGDLDGGVIGYEKVSENAFLALYFNPNNSYFAVKDKRNDFTWFSNTLRPDPNARTLSQRNLQRSTLQISYLQRDNTVATMNNFTFSIDFKRDFSDAFDVEYIDSGFSVLYRMVDRQPRGYWFPAYISRDRFVELVQNPVQLFGTQIDRRNLEQYYTPMSDDPDTFVIRQISADEETGEFDMNRLSGAQVQTLFRLFYEIGNYGNRQDEQGNYIDEYTLDDVAYDNAQFGFELETRLPEFHVPLRVVLEEDHLDVQIDYNRIESFNDYAIVSIHVLPYFGAAHQDDHEGYMVIPEGSGGLINYNNGKTSPISYSSFIYGEDIREIPEVLRIRDAGSQLPIFGTKNTDNAMLGVIHNGSAHSNVRSDVSLKVDSYNKIYNEFIFRQVGSYRLGENRIPIWNRETYVYSPNIKYYFFEGETANYTSMARLYGQYLSHRYHLEALPVHQRRFYFDILGSYDYDDFFLWFSVTRTGALTTYEEALLMIEMFKDAGIDEMTLSYLGWFNGGIEHSVPNRVSLDRALGSRRDFNDFKSQLNAYGIDHYFDVNFIKTYDSNAFYTTRNYARVIGGNAAEFYPFDPATRRPITTRDPFYLNNIAAINRNTTGFIKAIDRLGIEGVSLRHLGNMLYSDFGHSQFVPSVDSLIYTQQVMAKFDAHNVMLRNPHDYALPFGDVVVDLDTRSSRLVVVDESIPFYQLAIADYLPYAMPSFNMYDRYARNVYLLHALATGSDIKATLSYQSPTVLQNTQFLDYYETHFEHQFDFIVSMHETYGGLNIDNAYLVSHEIIGSHLVEVAYSNGARFIINFNTEAVTVNDRVIEGLSFYQTEVGA